MRSDTARGALSAAIFSAWIWLLFAGHTAGGAVHLLLATALAAFPWRALCSPAGPPPQAS